MKTKKLKIHLKILTIALLFFTIIFNGCKKENPSINNLQTNDEIIIKEGRLAFSRHAFTKLMNESHQKQSINLINNLVSDLKNHQDFISLKQEAINYVQTGKLSAISLKNSIQMSDFSPQQPPPPGGGPSLPPTDPIIKPIKLDSLVEDPYFASVLNPSGEIEVENVLYKVTEYGTFALESNNKTQIDSLIFKLDNNLVELNTILEPESEYLYKIKNRRIHFFDTYNLFGRIHFAYNTTSTIIDFPLGENVYGNVLCYEFNDANTLAGKALQNVFGRDHFNYFKKISARRLKVNFYSRNWLIFASVGVRSVIQKKNWAGFWGPVDNYDEMRLGWNNVIIKLNVPVIEDPTEEKNPEFWSVATSALKSNINFKFKNDTKEYLIYRVSDILEFNKTKRFLPFDLQNSLNNLLTKVNNTTLDFNKLLEAQLDKQAVERLAKIIKSIAADKTKEVAFTVKKRGEGIDELFFPPEWRYSTKGSDGAVQNHNFDFETAIIGWNSNTGFYFKPAKILDLKSGEVIGLGKLNGEWAGIAVTKK